MIKRTAHIFFSLWLILLLLLGTTPKEFIHSLAGHTDTVDVSYKKDVVVGNIHHHCSFQSFHLLPFAEGFTQPEISLTKECFHQHTVAISAVFIPHSEEAISLRGPPSA